MRYEKDAGAVKVRLYNLRGEDFIPVVCGAPEDAVGETVSVTVFVDGRPIPQENYTVADETEESLVSHMDTPDEVETVTDYIRVITATLPQPISADAKADCRAGYGVERAPVYLHKSDYRSAGLTLKLTERKEWRKW